MTDLTQLLERLESLEGPDREIDNLIAFVLDIPMPEDPAGWPPRYTESLDAAVALVERVLPGMKIELRLFSEVGTAQLFTGNPGQYYNQYQHRTAPLALITALVLALIAEEQK